MKKNLVLLFLVGLSFSACKNKSDINLPTISTVSPLAHMQAIEANFLGLSHEWGQAQLMIGNSGLGENKIYSQLIKNITDITQAPLSIRIGGNSTNSLNMINAINLMPLQSLAKKNKVEYIININLTKKDNKLALNQSKEIFLALNSLGLRSIELGYQPNTYIQDKFRDSTWSFLKYVDETKLVVDKIRQDVDYNIHFAGPSSIGFAKEEWKAKVKTIDFANLKDMSRFNRILGNAFNLYTFHHYSTWSNKCGGNIKSGALLPADMTRDNPNKIKAYAEFAKSKHIPLRITELNAVSCYGDINISDAYESALWLIDILFEYAYNGVSGINLHSNNWSNTGAWDYGTAFSFYTSKEQVTRAQTTAAPRDIKYTKDYEIKAINPIYYGLLFFAHASKDSMFVRPNSWDRTTNTKSWYLQNKNNKKRIVLINKSDKKQNYTLPEEYENGATLQRLTAANAAAKNKITFQGLTFDNSKDGKPIGTIKIDSIAKKSLIEVAPYQAIIINIQ